MSKVNVKKTKRENEYAELEKKLDNNELTKLEFIKLFWLKISSRFMDQDFLIRMSIVILVIFVSKYFNLVRVTGDSMYPTFEDGNILATSKNIDDIKRNDVIVFNVVEDNAEELEGISFYTDKNGKINAMFIKRIVGIPGDTIEIKNGNIVLNGREVEKESFEKMKEAGKANKPIKLKEDEYFVLGDNRNGSIDSREIGPIKKENITNKVKYKFLGSLLN